MWKFPRLLVNHVKALASPALSNKLDYLSQQTRNTFILKRRYTLPLHKKNQSPKRMKGSNFIYDLVEDTNVKRKKPLDLILTQYVAGLGNVGTRVTIHPTIAYPRLLLPKLAEYATPENIAKYMKLATDQGDNTLFSSKLVEKTIKYLSQKLISIVMSKDVSWTIEKWHIKASFRKAGIYLPEDAVTLPEKPISGPNLDIEGKDFYVTLTINNREQVKVRCRLHHWTPNKAEQIIDPHNKFWKKPSEPIFPEDKPILDSLPPFFVERKRMEFRFM